MGADGASLARRYERTLYVGVLLANYFAAAVLSIYFFLAAKMYPLGWSPGRLIAEMCAAGIPIAMAASLSGVLLSRLWIRPAMSWLREQRSPTNHERHAVSALPRRLATLGTVHWVIVVTALFIYLLTVLDYYPGLAATIRFLVSAYLLAIVPWSLSYLVVERSLRPVFALSVTEEVARLPKTMGLTARLILAWVATTGLPISGILIALVGLGPVHRQLAMPVVFAICILGGSAGIAVAIFIGRAIMDPLQKVRGALRSIERGDYDVGLPVSDSAELGDLEVGFNRMALGLRERERMREVFGRLVGNEVAERALESELGLGGERRTVTVMFVDIIGSTRLAQTHAPEEVVAVLNSFFDAVVRIVGLEGGFVNKFEGDGALCIFGAPDQLNDHAARALRAAGALRTALISLPDIDGIEASIGISSGEVVAGYVGAADRYEYTVIGDPVNEAARLREQAKALPRRILVSESTIRRADMHVDGWLPAGTMQLRGRAEATLAYEPA